MMIGHIPMFSLGASAVLLVSSPAQAQNAHRDCQNEPVNIDIRSQPMASGIEALSDQTGCPISRDAEDLRGLKANAVRGRMMPVQALSRLVYNQGLQAKQIRQGLAVEWYQSGRPPAPNGDDRLETNPQAFYDCDWNASSVAIEAQNLDAALGELTRITHCPISRDVSTDGYVSRAVNGKMTPLVALQRMVRGLPLGGKQIKGGLSIYKMHRR